MGPTPFETRIVEVLTDLGPGDLITYGEVALEAGRPGAARAVGRFLSEHGADVCWWRVVTASGRLVPGNEAEQARRLRREGVAIDRAGRRVARPFGR